MATFSAVDAPVPQAEDVTDFVQALQPVASLAAAEGQTYVVPVDTRPAPPPQTITHKGVTITTGQKLVIGGRPLVFIEVATRKPSFPFCFKYGDGSGRVCNYRASAVGAALGQKTSSDGWVVSHKGKSATVGSIITLTNGTRCKVLGLLDVKKLFSFKCEIVTKDNQPTGQTIKVPASMMPSQV